MSDPARSEQTYTVERLFSGSRTAEELISDLIRAHMI